MNTHACLPLLAWAEVAFSPLLSSLQWNLLSSPWLPLRYRLPCQDGFFVFPAEISFLLVAGTGRQTALLPRRARRHGVKRSARQNPRLTMHVHTRSSLVLAPPRLSLHQVTDGWYPMDASLDGALAYFLRKGEKIVPGTKLAVSNASLEAGAGAVVPTSSRYLGLPGFLSLSAPVVSTPHCLYASVSVSLCFSLCSLYISPISFGWVD